MNLPSIYGANLIYIRWPLPLCELARVVARVHARGLDADVLEARRG